MSGDIGISIGWAYSNVFTGVCLFTGWVDMSGNMGISMGWVCLGIWVYLWGGYVWEYGYIYRVGMLEGLVTKLNYCDNM